MKKNILVVSNGLIHPSFLVRKSLNLLLKNMRSAYNFTFTKKLADLEKTREKSYDAVILYYHLRKINPASLEALKSFAERGGGILVLHSSMASFKDNKEYQELLGGRFTGHGPVKRFNITAKDKNHEILEGVSNFSIRDELYIHEYDDRNHVVLECRDDSYDEPILWTKYYGFGKVCYFAPGHCVNVFHNREVKKIIRNALAWVCREENRHA